MINVTTPPNVAVGSVVTYGGDLSNAKVKADLIASGWLPCDGSSYPQSEYPELFAVISLAHGGDGSNFNVPNVTDRFVRGTNGNSNNDPDRDGRTAAAPGGATGDNVGSLQGSATALPHNRWTLSEDGDHVHQYQHLSTEMHEAWNGSTDRMARWNQTVTVGAAGAHFHSMEGGDPATVPINVALFWIIRAKPAPAAGATPAAALSAFAGSASASSPAGWLYCNGVSLALGTASQAFSSAIGSNFGGDGTTVFNLPDLRGQFTRGTNHGTGRDPDAAKRFNIMGGGNTGDNVGSAQDYATGNGATPITIASAGDHQHAVAGVPANDHQAAKGASGPLAYNTMEWTDNWTNTSSIGNHSHSVSGGDKETRPTNIYLDWVVAADNIADAPPIGTIMAYAGDMTVLSNLSALLAEGWVPCNGMKLRKNDPNYAALLNVIGTTFGGDNLNFFAPDLRGRFVIGAGGALGGAIGKIQTVSLTGQPKNPFVTTPIGDHTHTLYGPPSDTHVIDVVIGWDLAENNDGQTASSLAGAHTHSITSGGDAESRPINVNVDYIIRFK
jgi:microcystin-dependent protein